MIRVGLVGYGLAGAVFHAPLIRACRRMELSAVMTSREVPLAVSDLPALLEQSDVVVVASPNPTHFDIARRALEAGKHVVVDKPFTVTVAQADELIALAQVQRRKLTVFHNRRWDGDFLTAKEVLPRLGTISLFHAHWDRFRPTIKQGWKEVPQEGTGLLNDLGPHLIDQALQLFGRPEAITGDLAIQRSGAQVDDYFELTLHYGAMRAVLGASTLAADPRPRFAIHGISGSFVKYGLDPQEEALKGGADPLSPDFGADAVQGSFVAADGTRHAVPTKGGRYLHFYEAVASAILDDAPIPVQPEDARDAMQVIDLARQSASQGERLPVKAP